MGLSRGSIFVPCELTSELNYAVVPRGPLVRMAVVSFGLIPNLGIHDNLTTGIETINRFRLIISPVQKP